MRGMVKNEEGDCQLSQPGGELRRSYLKTNSTCNESIKRKLQRSDPFENKVCEEPEGYIVCPGKGLDV